MFKFKRKNKKGFTLTELLVVVLVISVLTAISIPSYKRAVERTRATQGITTLQNIAKAQAVYNARRGSYATNMRALPLDMKDVHGEDVVGDTFGDKFFDYTVYGDVLSQSYAKRSEGGYELAIDYETGKLYCTPEENETCKMLGFDVNTKTIPQAETENNLACNDEVCYLYDGDKIIGKCEFAEGFLDTCQSTDTNGFICIADECGEFRNGALLDGTSCKKDDLNKEGTACAKYTFECDKDKGLCYTYKDGEEIKSCPIDETGTMCKSEDPTPEDPTTGWVCKDGEDLCYFYDADGNSLDKCVANAERTGCIKDGEVVCRGDGKCTLSDGSVCIANKDNNSCEKGLICDYDGGWRCREFDNGKEVQSCIANEDRTGCLEEGKLVCRDGKCVDSQGNWCESNKEGTACKTATENVGSYYECDGDKCVVYDKDGKEIKSCYMDNVDCFKEFAIEGTLCNKDGVCLTYGKDGALSAKCRKTEDGSAYCDDYVNNKYNCESNSSMSGCKEESTSSGTWQCSGNTCKLVDEKGNVIQVCDMNKDPSCFENNKVDGVVCVEDGTCYTYENGKNVLECFDGKCYDKKGNECVANYYGTACRPEGNTSNRPCEVSCKNGTCSCWDENGALYFNCPYGDNECFKNVGFSGTYCDEDGNCSTYENGEQLYKCANSGICVNTITGKECISNETLTGCKEESTSSGDLECSNDICHDADGNECFGNGNGGCIEGKGTEFACYKDKGRCITYKDGKQMEECDINEAGTGCKEESTSSGAGYTCDGWTCVDDNGLYVCDSNGKDGCIEGKGEEVVCMDGMCMTYKDGKKTDWCTANDEGTGCKEESTSSGDLECSGDTCHDADGNECFGNGNGGCIEGKGTEFVCYKDKGRCITYKDGKRMEECDINEAGTGCKEGSTSTEPDNPKNGTVCYKEEDGKRCYTYKDGKLVDSCNANKTMDGCAPTDQDEELVCYKDLGVCYDFTTDGKIIGQCPINTAGTDCASSETDTMTNGLLCDTDKCYTYEDGKVVATCMANNTGTGCKEDSSEWKCEKYICKKDGKTCFRSNAGDICIKGEGYELGWCEADGKCYVYKNGDKFGMCNYGSSDAGGCSRNGFLCDGQKCNDFRYGHEISSCYSDNLGKDCIKGEGYELGWCDKDENCYVYKDGKESYMCKKGYSEYEGCDRNGFVCDTGKCSNFIFGQQTGTSCLSNNAGTGCIKGEGYELGWCNEADDCYVYKDGKEINKCQKGSSEENGCDRNGFTCIDGDCATFVFGSKIGDSCLSNNSGTGCIKGEGYELGWCDKEGWCLVFNNGKEINKCQKGSSEENGCDRNGFTCNQDGKCFNFVFGQQIGKECYSNNSGTSCITGKGYELGWCDKDLCFVYKDGSESHLCKKGSSDKEGCDLNGFVCDDWVCAEYYFGISGSSCYHNGSGGCIKGKGEETVCIDGKCKVYKDGVLTVDGCEANDDGTGCKEEEEEGEIGGPTCPNYTISENFTKDGKQYCRTYFYSEGVLTKTTEKKGKCIDKPTLCIDPTANER